MYLSIYLSIYLSVVYKTTGHTRVMMYTFYACLCLSDMSALYVWLMCYRCA